MYSILFRLGPVRSEKARERCLSLNTPGLRGLLWTQSYELLVAVPCCSAHCNESSRRWTTPIQASESPGLDSWIKSPSYKKDVMPSPQVHFSPPSYSQMRHRATSVPRYKGSMSAPPVLSTRDLSGKYILVRVLTPVLEGWGLVLTLLTRTKS